MKIFNLLDKESISEVIEFCSNTYSAKKKTFVKRAISYDIETSSYYDNDEKRACCYSHCFSFDNDFIIHLRKWKEFEEMIKLLNSFDETKIIIYVHNLSYEFQFIRKWLNITKMFALQSRKVCYFESDNLIFKCSYLLSGKSLSAVGEEVGLSKLKGELDYKLIRTPETKLTEQECKYIYHDVMIIILYIRRKINEYHKINYIPITKTSEVRQYCRKKCMLENYNFQKYQTTMQQTQLTPAELLNSRSAFMGGFTHANSFIVGKKLKKVTSYDINSSYPSVMFTEKYPMRLIKIFDNLSLKKFKKLQDEYCMIFTFEIQNVESKFPFEHILSKSRCVSVGAEDVNGRILTADYVKMTITDVDFDNIFKYYDFDIIAISNVYVYNKQYLPTVFIQSFLELYQKKTELKDVKDREIDYVLNKEKLNSTYGMCVTNILRDDIVYYNDDWQDNIPYEIQEKVDRYNKTKMRFLSYNWGVFITAYARNRLLDSIFDIGEDYVYSDTDSIKFFGNHDKYFEKINNEHIAKLRECQRIHEIKEEYFMPKTVKGKVKTLGIWENEGTYEEFKTLGAKRYAYTKNGHFYITVAGLPKTCNKYIDKKGRFDFFNNEMYIPKAESNKRVMCYIDDEFKSLVTDYQGNKCEIYERSAVHMEETDFTLNLSKQFIKILQGINEGIYENY